MMMIGLTGALNSAAAELGREAEAGRAVEQLTVLGLPLLDVSASEGLVSWTGPPSQRPKDVFKNGSPSTCVLFLGQSATTAYVINEPRRPQGRNVTRLPLSHVTFSSSEDCK